MEPRTIEWVEKSFSFLAPRADELVDRFYATLFTRNPGLRPMFPNQMGSQKKKLLSSIILVVKNLRARDRTTDAVMDMGERHAGYGVKEEHYPIARDTLIEVMERILADQWEPDFGLAWREVLDAAAGVMIEGQRRVEPAVAAR